MSANNKKTVTAVTNKKKKIEDKERPVRKEGNSDKSKKVPFPYNGTPDCRGYWI